MRKMISCVMMAIFMFGLVLPECAMSQDVVTSARNIIAESPLTLSDCYQLSLVQSEKIAIDSNLIKVTEAHFLQALSIMLPHVSFVSSDFQEEKQQGSTLSSAINTPKISQRQFAVTQTLFNGFKAFAGMKGSGCERKQRIHQKERAEQLLLADVSGAFYLLIETREDIRALQKIKSALVDRIAELRAREQLGRSRPSEVVNAKAQLYGVEASIEVVKSQEIIARQLLEFLIGRPVVKIVDTYELPKELLTEEHYLSRSYLRPDVKAAKYAWDLSIQMSRVIDSEFLPEVKFGANYYTQRTGFDKGTDWDVVLSVNVPIFEGTEVLGNSKEAALNADSKRLEYQRIKREVPHDIRAAYTRFKTAISVYELLKKAYGTAKLNYYLQKKDYLRSLVNNLDVLASIQTLQDTERNYIHALYEAKRTYWQLRVAVGQGGMGEIDDTF